MKNEKPSVLRSNQIICEKALFISMCLIMSANVAKVSICLSALKCIGIFISSYLNNANVNSAKTIHILHRLLIKYFKEPASLQKW